MSPQTALVITGATVHTLDPAHPAATAVAVSGGLITAVGTDAEIRALAGPGTEELDGRGLTVTPGLVDSHQHPLMGIAQSRGLDLMDAHDLDTVLARLRAEADRLGPDDWVVAHGVQYNAFGTRPLHRSLIDEAVGGRPAFLWMVDGHTALLSSDGLRRAGISGEREFADSSRIVVEDDGTPTGELHELQAVLLGQAAVPAPTTEEFAARLKELFAAQNRTGVTGVHILDFMPGTDDVLRLLDSRDELTVRTLLAPWCLPGSTDATVELIARLRERGGRLWRTGAVKLFVDGAVDGGGAWLCHADHLGQNDRSLWRDPEAYRAAVATFTALGLPCFTHAIGDEGVAYALQAYADAGKPVGGGRHRIEHIEVLHDEHVARFAELDVVASMNPTHMDWTLPDGNDNWSRRVGPVHAGQAWRYADILAAGGQVALASDWPIAPYDPREVMAGAVLRRPAGQTGRAPHLPGQALTPLQALRGYTVGAAYGAGEEAVAGRIAPGLRADLTVFAGDPLNCPADELPRLPVAATVVDGRVVHRAGV
ncbi:amidohydrolase [Streptomyces cyslabdanicus]|uniref:amidohydrolase n=1 Tax=Streptomyces cyslabdanicus TaxID=1470456 RepID=UPI0040441F81